MSESPARKYDPVAMTLHWLMALLFLAPLILTWEVEHMPREEREFILMVHSSNGIVLFSLALFRLWWRRHHPAPPYPDTMSPLVQRLAKANVHVFYTMMLVQPVLGFLHAATHTQVNVRPFGASIFPLLPNESITSVFHALHGLGAIIIIAALTTHIAAALYHFILKRDRILQRMLPFTRP